MVHHRKSVRVRCYSRTKPIQLADGTWMVQARANLSTLYCRDRLVLLTNRHGQLSGSVAFARASAPLHNLVLMPDGSFSGATRGGVAGSKLGRFYKVTGKFLATRSALPSKVLVVLLAMAQPIDARHAARLVRSMRAAGSSSRGRRSAIMLRAREGWELLRLAYGPG